MSDSLIHPTYKHLDRPARLAGLTLAQWAQVTAAGIGAFVLAQLLPFGANYDLGLAVTLTGVPTAVSLAGATASLPLRPHVRSMIRWRRTARLHQPGPPPSACIASYVLDPEETP